MKRVIICCFAHLLILFVQGQHRLEGVITDASGNHLTGANIVLKGEIRGTTSDLNGNFVFSSVKEGEHTLQVSYLGYKTLLKTIILERNTSLLLVLERSSIMADEVIIKSLRASEKDPLAYTNVDRDELHRVNTGNDIPFLLSLTPSLIATSETGTGIGYTALRIRGSDPTRINVTINGIPLNDSESQGAFWVDIPDFTASADNIQIQRGVGTSTNGAASFGGTINFQTTALNHDPYLEIRSTSGSFKTFKNSVKVGTGMIDEKFSFDARFSKILSDGYIKHTASNHTSFFLTGAWYSQKNLLRATVISGEEHTGISWWGVPDYMLETDRRYNPAGEYLDSEGDLKYYEDQKDNYWQTHYQLHFSREISQELIVNAAIHYTRGTGYYEQYMDDENSYHSTLFYEYGLDSMFILNNDTILSSDLVRQKWLDNDFYGLVFSSTYTFGKTEASIGGGWNYYDGDHFGKILWVEKNNLVPKNHEWYFNTGRKSDWNIYAKLNYSLSNRLNAFADLQYRKIVYKMSGPDDDLTDLTQKHTFGFFNPKLGLHYTIHPGMTTFLSFSIGQREPARSDFKDATGDEEATPKPEKLYDFEAGFSRSGQFLNLALNGYYMYYKDQLVPTGEKSNVGNDIMTNVDISYRAGIELQGALKITDRLIWDLNVTLSSNKIKNFVEYATYYDENWNETYQSKGLGKSDLAYSPSLVGSSRLAFKLFKGLELSLSTKYVGSQYFDNTSSDDRKLDPYHVTDLRIDYVVNPGWMKELGFQVQVNNLFNNLYISNAYGGNWYEQGEEKSWIYYFPQAGMHFLAGFYLKF